MQIANGARERAGRAALASRLGRLVLIGLSFSACAESGKSGLDPASTHGVTTSFPTVAPSTSTGDPPSTAGAPSTSTSPSATAAASTDPAPTAAPGARSASASAAPVPTASASASAAASVAASATPSATPEAPLSVQSDKVQADTFGVWMQTAKSYKVGQTGSVEVVVVPKGEFHCNEAYPYKVKMGAAPAGVTYPQDIVRGASISAARTSIRVPFVATAAGSARISGKFSFSVCKADQCIIDSREVAATVKIE